MDIVQAEVSLFKLRSARTFIKGARMLLCLGLSNLEDDDPRRLTVEESIRRNDEDVSFLSWQIDAIEAEYPLLCLPTTA